MIFIGTGAPDAEELTRSLAADTIAVCPAVPLSPSWRWTWGEDLDAWRREVDVLPPADEVVMCTWLDDAAPSSLIGLEQDEWRRQVEWPTALWFSTLVAATGRCRDGGSVVAVVDRPATLDANGRAAEVVVAEGVINLVRSLAAREGGRGVRVNAVVTSRHTDPADCLGTPPPLAAFPGRIEVEVVGAVRLLLSGGASGITGTALSSTCGRR